MGNKTMVRRNWCPDDHKDRKNLVARPAAIQKALARKARKAAAKARRAAAKARRAAAKARRAAAKEPEE